MICISIIGPTIAVATEQIAQASSLGNVLELRLDLFEGYTFEELQHLREQIALPVIFTLRKTSQGGHFKGNEVQRLEKIRSLATLKPTYLDLEYDTSLAFVKEMGRDFPEIQRIISYHDYAGTPPDLDRVLKEMHCTPGELYKIACTAHSTLDALRMLLCIRSNAPLLGMCMGELGTITRILGPRFGSPWSYACLSEENSSAPGQLSAQETHFVYDLNRLSSHCALYGLIGSPVSTSLSQYTHNRVFQDLGLDAIYVKMQVESCELKMFLELAKQAGFCGLSVTMPLKEQVLPYLDAIDPEAASIGAVNTLLIDDNKIKGFNTDGKGALDAIETRLKVRDQKVAIVGSGGAARAIIYEALKRGALVSIWNRTPKKALSLALSLQGGIQAGSLDTLQPDYDVLINTTPDPMPIDVAAVRPQSVIMDIKTSPVLSTLLQQAEQKQCTLIYGGAMFINQALGQFALWFPEQDFFKEGIVQLTLCLEQLLEKPI